MKRILSIVFLLCLNFAARSQYPITQNLGSSSTLVQVPATGGLRAAFVNRSFADTATANLHYIAAYPFAQIATTGDGNLWMRNASATGWSLLGGGLSPSGTFWNVGGNLFPVTATTRNMGTLAPYGGAIGLMTNSVVRLIINDTGLFRNQTATDSVLVRNSSNEVGLYPLSYFGGSYTAGDGLLLTGTQFKVLTKRSITIDSDSVMLVNDTTATPANYFYGMNSAGRRGWYAQSGIGWALSGNTVGSYGSYLGTNDDFDLRFFTNGTERMRIDSATGRVGIGGIPDPGGPAHTAMLRVYSSGGANTYSAQFLDQDSTKALTVGFSVDAAQFTMTDGTGNYEINSRGQHIMWNSNTFYDIVGYNGYSYLYTGIYGNVILNRDKVGSDLHVKGTVDDSLLHVDAYNNRVFVGDIGSHGDYKFEVATNAYVNGYIGQPNISLPSTPASGYGYTYVRADTLRFLNSAGTEFTIGMGGGSATTYYNSNLGSGYRLAVPNTNGIKTLFGSFGLDLDSTTNTNAITATIDTALITTTSALIDSIAALGSLIVEDEVGVPLASSSGDDVHLKSLLDGTNIDVVNTSDTTVTINLTGTVGIANGGTNNTATPTAGALAYGDGSKITYLSPGSDAQSLMYRAAGTAPKWIYDTTAIASFGGGSGAAGDTAVFSTSALYGSFFNSGNDTIYLTNVRIGLQGTSPNVTVTVYWNDSLAVTAGATKAVNAGNAATNIYTGTSVTSFDNQKIPPGVWVWVQTTTVTTKPTYLTLTLIGYRKKV